MKETIEYYYGIDIDNLEEFDGKYHFKIENVDFFFVFYNRGEEELEDILNVVLEIKNKGIDVNNLLLNKDGKFLTKVNQYNYILFCVSNIGQIFDIFAMMDIMNLLTLTGENSKLYRNNWANLWSSKIDYFEQQVRELALKKPIVKNSFSYYIGLAEVAISYVNNANLKYNNLMKGKLTLAHRRIFYPNYKLNYLNPLSFIFDLEVRDIAEYLKSMFFKVEPIEVLEELKSYLKVVHLNDYEYSMLLARLIYPTFYFDIYEEVMNKEVTEEKLVDIIKKAQDYELFLKDAYIEISKYAKIDKISFLIN